MFHHSDRDQTVPSIRHGDGPMRYVSRESETADDDTDVSIKLFISINIYISVVVFMFVLDA